LQDHYPQLARLPQIEAVSAGKKPAQCVFDPFAIGSAMLTNHPVRKLGRQPFRRIPLAHLCDVEADAKLSLERDLRFAPTPISGGMRKALVKELGHQNALRFKARRRYREPDLRRSWGLLISACPRCHHVMYFDDATDDLITCDRCKKTYG
jgi:hypothetical protein